MDTLQEYGDQVNPDAPWGESPFGAWMMSNAPATHWPDGPIMWPTKHTDLFDWADTAGKDQDNG